MKKQSSRRTGPKPERIKSDKNWEEAISDAMKKKRPKNGWPKTEKKKR